MPMQSYSVSLRSMGYLHSHDSILKGQWCLRAVQQKKHVEEPNMENLSETTITNIKCVKPLIENDTTALRYRSLAHVARM